MKGQILCILADVRSGSTLLTQLLGANPEIVSVGEIHYFPAYVTSDRRLYNPPNELICACGSKFSDCRFWQSVCAEISRSPAELRLMPRFFGWVEPDERESFFSRFPRRFLYRCPAVSRSRLVQAIYDGRRVAEDSMEVFEAIFRATGTRYIVDSSKNVFRYRLLHEWYPDRVKMLVLHRDYRAVIYSKMKRGEALEGSAFSWKLMVRQIEALVADVPSSSVMSMKYEDLCRDPVGELRRVCQFLEIEFDNQMLTRPSSILHDLGGSPSKFQNGRSAIRLDTEYLSKLTAAQLEKMRSLVGPAAERCGYR